MEQKRQELLVKYHEEIMKDYSNDILDKKEFYESPLYELCPEFISLCITSSPEFAIRVLESLYGNNKLEILK